jgi:hypothetical protein
MEEMTTIAPGNHERGKYGGIFNWGHGYFTILVALVDPDLGSGLSGEEYTKDVGLVCVSGD